MAAPVHPVQMRRATLATHLESLDPATGEVFARWEITPPTELVSIIERARSAQRDWATWPIRERCALLTRLGEAFFARRHEIAERITRESGKPLVEATFADVVVSLDSIRFYARRAPELLRPECVPHHNIAVKGKTGWLYYEPYGVIGLISPWNYPLAIPMGQIAAALAAGNTVVLKPSELTPGCGELIGELCNQAGFPASIVTVVQGGGEVGAALIEGQPDKIIFTGSVATGRRVAEACARRLIPSLLELGGKDAMLVLADADLEVASSAAVWGSFTNCGQACLSVERLYVEQNVAERFTELCVAKTKKLKLGPGLEAETEVGPMIRPSQVERVEQHLRDAVARGAQILAGGQHRPDLGPCFFEPTVVTGVDDSMLLMQEETFGPVLAIRAVADAEEAVRLVNDSPFGLAASIWTRDTHRGVALAARLETGAVMVNDLISYFGITEAPHGGRRASGWGRSHGRLGLLELVQPKYVDVDRLSGWPKAWWYGYNRALRDAADRLVELLYGPGLRRLRSLRGALRTVFRDHHI